MYAKLTKIKTICWKCAASVTWFSNKQMTASTTKDCRLTRESSRMFGDVQLLLHEASDVFINTQGICQVI
jgi:hypothetical protein